MTVILGITDGHDPGAAIVKDGKIIAAVAEERLTRQKVDIGFPYLSIKEVIDLTGIPIDDIDAIAIASYSNMGIRLFSDLPGFGKHSKPLLGTTDFKKNIGSFKTTAWKVYRKIFPNYASRTHFIEGIISRRLLSDALKKLDLDQKPVKFIEHHTAHASVAYWTSNFDNCAVVTMDGGGDGLWLTVSIGKDGEIKRLSQTPDKNSLGAFYGRVTEILGYRRNEHEYKIMGLAAFGDYKPAYDKVSDFFWVDGLQIKSKFDFFRKTDILDKLKKRFEGFDKKQICAAVQRKAEDVIVELMKNVVKETGMKKIAFAGGVALNVKANKRALEESGIDDLFIHPNAGDGGLAAGAALKLCTDMMKKDGKNPRPYLFDNAYLGREYSNEEIEQTLKNYPRLEYKKSKDIFKETAKLMTKKNVIAWFQGKMEYGPRALGNRSVVADPRERKIIDRINLILKKRDWFMPFAPSMHYEAHKDYLLKPKENPFMTMAFDVTDQLKKEAPAIVHVDDTTRPQTVRKEVNERYWKLIDEFRKLTGNRVIINTSLNIHGYPIVGSPKDVIEEVLMQDGVDYLAIGDFLVKKK